MSLALAHRRQGPINGSRLKFTKGVAKRRKALPSRPDEIVKLLLHHGRMMLVERCEMLPVECIVRGYLSGSGWKEYRATGAVSGLALPAGLREADRLPEPIFTPSTKAAIGDHDENISYAEVDRSHQPGTGRRGPDPQPGGVRRRRRPRRR